MYRIFIIEDDEGLADGIRTALEAWEFETCCVKNFRDVMAEFSAFSPHLALIDVALPFFNGFYWCAEIRKRSNIPLVFLSSAADNMNVVMAMNMGADDFIAKPFDAGVLTAKIGALLRRSYDFAAHAPVLSHRGALLDTGAGMLLWQGEKIELSKNEYRILLTLWQSKGKTVSREKLMKELWETDCFVDENTLNVNVGRLRKKLDSAGLCGFITTKFGVGYLMESP